MHLQMYMYNAEHVSKKQPYEKTHTVWRNGTSVKYITQINTTI